VTSPAQVSRLRTIGAVAVVQPCFVDRIGDVTGGASFDDHTWLAFGAMTTAGVPLAASSDDPCAPFPPLWGKASMGGEFSEDPLLNPPLQGGRKAGDR